MNEELRASGNRRWPGVVLSLLVPGFGLLRAGYLRRAIAWFVCALLVELFVVLALALGAVPVWLLILTLVAAVALGILMLRDSFRPGRMTTSLWILLPVLVMAYYLLPTPASLMMRRFKIPTAAMEPALMGEGTATVPDHVIVDRVSYLLRAPQRGDLIVFATSRISGIRPPANIRGGEVYYIKRLVGLPGERIRISDGKVYADGRLLGKADGIPDIHYTQPEAGALATAQVAGGEFLVGPEEYFGLGDNSSVSFDSRYWGCIPASGIYGKVSLIYYPFSRAGRIGRAAEMAGE